MKVIFGLRRVFVIIIVQLILSGVACAEVQIGSGGPTHKVWIKKEAFLEMPGYPQQLVEKGQVCASDGGVKYPDHLEKLMDPIYCNNDKQFYRLDCDQPASGMFRSAYRTYYYCGCRNGMVGNYSACSCPDGTKLDTTANRCISVPREMACSAIGNPVLPGTGQKISSETDFFDIRGSLSFQRRYSSKGLRGGTLGDLWVHNWDRRIDAGTYPTVTDQLTVIRGDGTRQYFTRDAASKQWQPSYAYEQGRLNGRLAPTGETVGWEYIAEDDSSEIYGASGQLLSVTTRAGSKTILAYSDASTPQSIAPAPGLVIAVTDQFGRTLKLSYNAEKRVSAVTSPAGDVTSYEYSTSGMLSKVVWPDARFRTYVYEDTRFPSALTGMIDEAGTRFGTYAYDAVGRAISSEHAGGTNRFQFQYPTGGATSVTYPNGANTTLTFEQKGNDLLRSTGASSPCPDCGGVAMKTAYDSNSNVASQADSAGRVSCFSYDPVRNLETTRVEGLPVGTACPSNLAGYVVPAGARKVSTSWHGTYVLPLKEAVPGKVTTFEYDAQGNVLTRTEQASNDVDGGQGLGAALVGTPRTWTYTYNTDSQMLTEKGPRTDVEEKTTYVYREADDSASPPGWRRGDLYQVKNAVGHTLTFERNDGAGRPLEVRDANGAVRTYSYSPRGWLLTRTVTPASGAGQTTAYAYDAVGQLTRVTQADGSYVAYSYDGAHRLTGLSDSEGNRVVYTLDATGNRVQEEVTGSGAVLARRVVREYNGANWLRRVTGLP